MPKSQRGRRTKRLSVDWFNASTGFVLTQAGPNATTTLFATSSLSQTSPFQDSTQVLIRRVILRICAGVATTITSQLIHLVITLMERRPGEAQFLGNFSNTDSQIATVMRTEVRSAATSTAQQSYDTVGGNPWVFDTGPINRWLGATDNLILASNVYVTPNWSQSFGLNTLTCGVDIQVRILFSLD